MKYCHCLVWVNVTFYHDLLNWWSLHHSRNTKSSCLWLSYSMQSIKKCFSSSMQFLLQTRQSLSSTGIEARLFLYYSVCIPKVWTPNRSLVWDWFYELDFQLSLGILLSDQNLFFKFLVRIFLSRTFRNVVLSF